MKFRFDIGFLRAFSVLIVMFYHFKIPFFSGGFLGVDIFFVISGFLMTKIVLSGIDKNTFSFYQFYLKRAKRIIPALLFLLLFVLIISMTLFLPADLRLNSKYVFLSPIFLSNIYFWLYSGYFDPSSQTNILLHTWSLSVEWQFYILYPILLLPLKNVYLKRKKTFTMLFFIFTLSSFILMLLMTKEYNSFSFYMFPTRAWEMTLGGLVVLLPVDYFSKFIADKFKKTVVLFCYVVLVLSTIFIDDSMIWPSVLTPIPVLAVFLILSLNVEFKLFESKIIQFVGNTSYSLYLWHWPLYIVFMYFGLGNILFVLLLIVLSLIFATLSYFYVERNEFIIKTNSILIVMTITLTISSFLFFRPTNEIVQSLSIYNKDLLNLSFNSAFRSAEDNKKWIAQNNPCNCVITQNLTYKDYDEEKCLSIVLGKKNILLLGDSHAAQISGPLREKLGSNYNVSEASASYVFPFVDAKGKKDSKFLMNKVFNEFIKYNYQNIDVVLISTHFLMYRNGSLGYSRDDLGKNLLKTITYLRNLGIKVVVVGQTESYSMPYPKIRSLSQTFGKNLESRYIEKDGYELNEYFKTILSDDVYIDVYNSKIQKFDKKTKEIYMFDDNHLSKYGADQLVPIIIKYIE